MRKKLWRKLCSFVLVLALAITMMPGITNPMSVNASENPVYVTLHFYNTYDWETPALQFWGGSSTEVTDYATTGEISGWGVQGYTLTSEGDHWYKITLKGDFSGFQFLDFGNPNSGNTGGKGYDANIAYCTESTATNLYSKWGEETGYEVNWYLDASYETSIESLAPSDAITSSVITMHFQNSDNWDAVSAYFTEGGSWSAIKGYTAAAQWPGVSIASDSANEGWYTFTVSKDASQFNCIFNNAGGGAQTGDISFIPDSETEERWIYGTSGTISETAPEGWVSSDANDLNDGTGETTEEDDDTTEYQYTVYYYDATAAHMSTEATDLWAWEVGGGNIGPFSFSECETLSDGNSWLKASFTSSATEIGLIPRSAGSWDWQTGNHYISNTDKASEMTVFIVYGDDSNTYTEIPSIKEVRNRYVVVEYNRPEGDYDGWNIYSWNSGFGSSTEIYAQEYNGKYYMIVPVKDSDAEFTLGFCMRKTTADNPWAEKDGGDHMVVVPADQNVVHVVFDQGSGIVSTYPYNKGYEMRGDDSAIDFFYRSDDLVLTNEEDSLDDVKVVVNGTTYDLSYDEINERYSYTLEGATTGEYAYYYLVNGEKVLDAFNDQTTIYDGQECSVFTFKHFDNLKVSATLANRTMDYNDNNVLSVSLTGKDAANITDEEIASATCDLSALGLGEMSIDTELMKVSIAVTSDTKTGSKKIPVTVKDIYGNTYTTKAKVSVVRRRGNDFDWDEAVIYFTVTDRFYDGNSENNEGVDKEGSLSYHGGDFAGLEEKLDYLEELGVNTIWITPIVENSDTTTEKDGETIESTGYHGYWASDFTALNSHLGTEEEFESLVDAVHARDMKIMVDVVLNHAGYETEDYFNTLIMDENGNYIDMIRSSENTITGDDVYASLAGLPDFVTEDEAVRDQLIEWQTDWVEKFGIDYFRVDTVKHVNSTTWAALKNALTEIDPDFKMIGEYSGAGYANTGGELATGTMDSLLDFDFNDQTQNFLTGTLTDVESFMESRNESLNNTATMGAFLSSHDEDGLVYKLINENGMTEEEALNAFKVGAALELTAKGQVVIYYGEEIGQYGANNYPYQTNRYDFDWDEAQAQEGEAGSMLEHYQKLLAIRNEYTDVFAHGDRTSVAVSDEAGYDIFARSYGSQTLYVGLNISDAQEVTFTVDQRCGTWMQDLYSGEYVKVGKNGTVTVTLPSAADGGTVILAPVKTVPVIHVGCYFSINYIVIQRTMKYILSSICMWKRFFFF